MDALIVVPAYNESSNLSGVLQGLVETCSSFADILVVDDGSVDGTPRIAGGFPVQVVSHPWNMGYGAALQTGYRYALLQGYSYVVQFDADGQHDPRNVIAILQELARRPSDLVIGSRYRGDPLFRAGIVKSVAVSVFRSLILLFTRQRVSDPTSGIRGLSRRMFSFYSRTGQFPKDFPDADFLVDALLRRFRMAEVAVNHLPRRRGRSMHAGVRPLFYMMKVMLNMLMIVGKHAVTRGSTSYEEDPI